MGIYLRKLYTTVFLLGIILQFSAQNRFSEGESSEYQGGGASYEVAVPNEMDVETGNTTPPPVDPVPIDDYLPLLVIIAAVLIAYKTYHRKSLSR